MENVNLIFICTGNICRSPMAEYLLRDHLKGEKIVISSAGLHAAPGFLASSAAIEALKERGIDMTRHRSRFLTESLVTQASLLVVMTQGHAMELTTRHIAASDKVHLLTSFAGKTLGTQAHDIEDPIGCSLTTYRAIRDEIDTALLDLILFLKKRFK